LLHPLSLGLAEFQRALSGIVSVTKDQATAEQSKQKQKVLTGNNEANAALHSGMEK
jgi:hypothetical protein